MTRTRTRTCSPVGYAEIGEILAMEPVTVRQWKWKGQMPEPDYPSIHGMPAWERATIIEWAGDMGKLRTDELRDEFRALTGREAHKYRRGGRLAAAPSKADQKEKR
jgi:hypothetical protein